LVRQQAVHQITLGFFFSQILQETNAADEQNKRPNNSRSQSLTRQIKKTRTPRPKNQIFPQKTSPHHGSITDIQRDRGKKQDGGRLTLGLRFSTATTAAMADGGGGGGLLLSRDGFVANRRQQPRMVGVYKEKREGGGQRGTAGASRPQESDWMGRFLLRLYCINLIVRY
jgi:hypothetical protein